MTLEVETVVAVSLMMAVFSAVAAVGTSIVLGVGFERLRSGFEVVKKQTGFFSDAIYKLEEKFEVVDEQTEHFSHSMTLLEEKVLSVGEQANMFGDAMQGLEKKVNVVDKQTAFFSDAIHKLEKKVDDVTTHEQIVSEKIKQNADVDLISTAKTDVMIAHAEDLLTQMASLTGVVQEKAGQSIGGVQSSLSLSIPKNLDHYVHKPESGDGKISFH